MFVPLPRLHLEKDWKKIKNNHFTPNIAVIKHIGLDKILLIGEKNCLINKKTFKEIKKIDFSKTLNILPGILVGRLHKDRIIPWNRYNKLVNRI